MEIVILVPVKNRSLAKLRLASILSEAERLVLSQAMFADTAHALQHANVPVAVVTNSKPAAGLARSFGWQVLWEAEQSSESQSVDEASRKLMDGGAEAVLRVPADLPLLDPSDIKELLDFPRAKNSALMVPSRSFDGTNALLRTPPDLFPSRFGPNSFALHTKSALEAGAELRIVGSRRMSLDIDDVADLACFMQQPSDTETYRYLFGIGLYERLSGHAG